jgi:hypothetical protein
MDAKKPPAKKKKVAWQRPDGTDLSSIKNARQVTNKKLGKIPPKKGR